MFRYLFILFCFIFSSLFSLHGQTLNIAKNKLAKQSSTTTEGGSANLAVDNNIDGNFNNGSVTKTNNEANAWWQVDLEEKAAINLVKIYNRTDAFSERLSNFYIFFSETDLTGRSFSDIKSDCNIAFIYVRNEVSTVINIPNEIEGRYVRIQLAETNILSLAEVEVYQKNNTNTDCSNFCLIDDFDEHLNGSIRGQGNWQTNDPGALDGAIISSEVNNGFIGKALISDPNNVAFRGNAYKPLNNSISNGSKGTLFFQILAEDLPNTYSHFGLTDIATPRLNDGGTNDKQLYNDYEVQMSLDHGKMRVRNGNTNSYLSNIKPESGVIYNIWMVIDNANNKFEVYIKGGVHLFPTKGKTENGTSKFSFRNGTTEALKTLYLINSPDNVENEVIFYDHFYIDNTKENVSMPIMVSDALSFLTIDTFETHEIGTVNGKNNWTSNSNSTKIDLDPLDNTNKVLKIEPGSMNAYLPIPEIRDCDTGTLFFRIQRSGFVNESVGLSDVANPTEFADYENQINMQNTSDNLNGRSGGSFLTLDNITNNQWYCVWMVTNNPANTYQIYLQGNGENTPKKLSSGSLSDFSYRNNNATNALSTFFIKQNNSAGNFYIDDIFMHQNKTNLSHPSSGQCNHGDVIVDNSEPLNDPIPETITTNGIGLVLEEFVTIPESSSSSPNTRINFLNQSNDNSGRLFVNDLNNKLYVIENKIVKTYLDVSSKFPYFAEEPRLGSGFGFFAFHPEFASNGKFYTVHTERFDALTINTPDFVSNGTDDMHGIITEWTATNPSLNEFAGSKREVLRIGFDTYLHGFQQISFNPTAEPGNEDYGLLYLALGDGEENPVFSGAPQDLSVPHGKILCIDPLGNNATNGNYGIPTTNPFVSTNDALGEIWAYGFRNPHRFSWDLEGSNKMFIGNIGEKNIDAIYLGEKGANYGWNEREGSFLFKKDDPNNVYALPEDDATNNYTYPVAEYDHDEGFAVVSGFVYRGNLIPGLKGKYIFGDIVKGRVFYMEEHEMIKNQSFTKIHEFFIYDDNGNRTSMLNLAGNSRADLRFGLDAQNELYLLSKQNGKIWKAIGANGLSVDSFTNKVAIKTFPNPTEDVINFSTNATEFGSIKIAIYNLMGQEIKTINLKKSTNTIKVSVSDLPKGIFLVKLINSKINYTTKFVKE